MRSGALTSELAVLQILQSALTALLRWTGRDRLRLFLLGLAGLPVGSDLSLRHSSTSCQLLSRGLQQKGRNPTYVGIGSKADTTLMAALGGKRT